MGDMLACDRVYIIPSFRFRTQLHFLFMFGGLGRYIFIRQGSETGSEVFIVKPSYFRSVHLDPGSLSPLALPSPKSGGAHTVSSRPQVFKRTNLRQVGLIESPTHRAICRILYYRLDGASKSPEQQAIKNAKIFIYMRYALGRLR